MAKPNLIRRVFAQIEKRISLENPAVPLGAAGFWNALRGGESTASGEVINEERASTLMEVYTACRVISEMVGALPMVLYERLPNGRKKAIGNSLFSTLAYEPNSEMSSVNFFEAIVYAMALTGNAYAEIEWANGQVQGLWPLHPQKTRPVRLSDGKLAYRTEDGQSNGTWRIVADEDMLHFRLFSLDGILGLSPIMQARQGVGLAIAAEKFGARFFGNNSRPGGIMSTTSSLRPEQINDLRASFEEIHSGQNQGRVGFLPGDWKYQALSVSPDEAQFLETRQFQRTGVAAMFRLPPRYLGDTSKSSKASSEQENLEVVTDCLRPYLARIESEINRKLTPKQGRKANKLFVQFDVRERLRGDFQTTMAGFALGKQWGFYNTNMILEQLGENPIGPIGDVFWVPVNMMNAERLLDPPTDDNAPTPNKANPHAQDGVEGQARSIMTQYGQSIIPLFKQAVGKVSARDNRDFEAVHSAFEPVLRSITSLAESDSRQQFGLPDAWSCDAPRLIREHVKQIEKRCATWTTEGVNQAAAVELRKAMRAIVLNIYRQAGASIADGVLKG